METLAENVLQKSKLLIKGLLIAGLVVMLLLPTYYVKELISERETRQKEAFNEVSSKWAGRQNLTGPVLVLPYIQLVVNGKDTVPERKLIYILPDVLTIDAKANPEKRSRGIYQVMLYSSSMHIAGKFNPVSLQQLRI